jgi:hypothetical protein
MTLISIIRKWEDQTHDPVELGEVFSSLDPHQCDDSIESAWHTFHELNPNDDALFIDFLCSHDRKFEPVNAWVGHRHLHVVKVK